MSESGITHILFDLGNVLVELRPIETVAAMSPSLIAACAKINPIVEDYECGRVTTDDFLARAPQVFGLSMPPDELRERFKLIVGEWYAETEPLLQTLRTRYHLGCLSNTNPLHIDALRERGPHLGLLHDCFFSHETGYVKPDAAAYEHVLATWQVAPARILFLDDRAENVDAARNIGMQAIHTFGPKAVVAACAAVLGCACSGGSQDRQRENALCKATNTGKDLHQQPLQCRSPDCVSPSRLDSGTAGDATAPAVLALAGYARRIRRDARWLQDGRCPAEAAGVARPLPRGAIAPKGSQGA